MSWRVTGNNWSQCLLLILLQPSHPFWSRKAILSGFSAMRSLCCQISGNYITKEAEGRIIALCNCFWITIKAAPPPSAPPTSHTSSLLHALNEYAGRAQPDVSCSIRFTPRMRLTDSQYNHRQTVTQSSLTFQPLKLWTPGLKPLLYREKLQVSDALQRTPSLCLHVAQSRLVVLYRRFGKPYPSHFRVKQSILLRLFHRSRWDWHAFPKRRWH